MNSKNFSQSWTMVFAVAWLILQVLGAVGFADFQPSQELQEVAGILVGIVMILLRKKTTRPVNWPKLPF